MGMAEPIVRGSLILISKNFVGFTYLSKLLGSFFVILVRIWVVFLRQLDVRQPMSTSLCRYCGLLPYKRPSLYQSAKHLEERLRLRSNLFALTILQAEILATIVQDILFLEDSF